MQFTIQRASFQRALNDVLRAISSRTTIPILTHIKFELIEEYLQLTGSNADISIEIVIKPNDDNQLKIETTGAITLPATFFASIVSKLPADEMSLSVDNLKAIIRSGKTNFTINGQAADQYPKLPALENVQSLSVSAAQLVDVINQTIISATAQESRPILTGVHMQIKNKTIKAVATDSHRLSQRILNLSVSDSDIDSEVIIPAKALKELVKMLDGQNLVQIQLTPNQAVFSLDNATFYSRLLEGNYPETDRLIPSEATTTLTMDAKELYMALDRASLLSHESRNNVVQLTLTANSAVVSGVSQEIGNVREDLPINGLIGEDLEISFNPDYVRDALRVFTDKAVDLSFTSNLRPFTVTLAGAEDKVSQLQLITPVRTF